MVVHEVLTAERVPFRYRVAGLGSRFLAWIVDVGCILTLAIVGLLLATVLESRGRGVGSGFFLLWTFALQWGYFVCFEWLWHGQTPGKRLLGIEVIQIDGTGITFMQSAIRNLLRVADGLPLLIPDLPPCAYGLGFAFAACNREQRRLGDLAANTLVVHVERRSKPLSPLQKDRTEMDNPRASMVRQRLSQLTREQKQALVDLCLRRDQLRVVERARIFQATADYFKNRLDLYPSEYQSDEKFVIELISAMAEKPNTP